MATAADWMSAASFISMAGLISFLGYEGGMYLMGWTGGYVLLAMLLAPYLRKFGKFTVPEFIGDRYYSQLARVVAVICLIFISFTYVAGQMRGVGIVFSRFLEVPVDTGLLHRYGRRVRVRRARRHERHHLYPGRAVLRADLSPTPCRPCSSPSTPLAIPSRNWRWAANWSDGTGSLLEKLDQTLVELGFGYYTAPFNDKSMIDVCAITLALMVGTAGLPHVIVRFFTVPRVRDARISAGWALLFITILYTTAPAVGALARINLVETVNGPDGSGTIYAAMPDWFKTWESSGLLAWYDHNGDSKVQYAAGNAFAGDGKPQFNADQRGPLHQRLTTNPGEGEVKGGAPFANEIYVDRDIMVLANPEIAGLPNWIIALVAAGGIAAALSTAAGLLAGDLRQHLARPAQEYVRTQHQREERADGRTHRRRGGDRHRRLPRPAPARLRRTGGRVRLRPGRRLAVPCYPDGDLQQAHEQVGRHLRHARRTDLHTGLHHLVQGRVHRTHGCERAGELDTRYLPGRRRRDRHGDQLRSGDRNCPQHRPAPATHPATGGGDPGAAMSGWLHQEFSSIKTHPLVLTAQLTSFLPFPRRREPSHKFATVEKAGGRSRFS